MVHFHCEKVPILVLLPKEKVPVPTWYFFPLVRFPSIRIVQFILHFTLHITMYSVQYTFTFTMLTFTFTMLTFTFTIYILNLTL